MLYSSVAGSNGGGFPTWELPVSNGRKVLVPVTEACKGESNCRGGLVMGVNVVRPR